MRMPKNKTNENKLEGINRRQNLRANVINFKKKKKEENTEDADDEPAISKLDPGTVSKKVIKLIEEMDTKFTAGSLIMAFHYVAKNSQQNCYDINLPYWFERYYEEIFKLNVDLIESSFVLEAVISLFSRRVDNFYSHVRQRVTSKSNQTQESADDNNEESPDQEKDKEKDKKVTAAKGRQITNKATLKNDRLYEVDMVLKKFKPLAPSKVTETLQSLNSLEAPKKYFDNYHEYKEWRKMYKKKMKNPIPYSIVSEESYIHPSMFKLSCIEDFDFDDDKHSKRNYSMFTNYIEHRYSTLVPDVNFITHFKVKDFIEAEEDEIEMMRILGLPTPPTRSWPPFCKMPNNEASQSIDSQDCDQDYIKTYIALEDIALNQKHDELLIESNRPPLEVFSNQTESVFTLDQQTQRQNIGDVASGSQIDLYNKENFTENANAIVIDQVSLGTSLVNEKENTEKGVDSVFGEEDIFQSQLHNENDQIPSQDNIQKNTATDTVNENFQQLKNTVDKDSKLDSESLGDPQKCEIVPLNLLADSGYVPGESCCDNTEKTGTLINTSGIKVLSVEVIKAAPLVNESSNNNVKNESGAVESENNEIDEGVWFSEVDEVTRAMFNPVVQLTDICKHAKLKPEEVHFKVDDELMNMFAFDDIYLKHQEEFKLPLDILVKQTSIKNNIFKFPEKYLRKKAAFRLPSDEFDRLKTERKRNQQSCSKHEPKIKLYKLDKKFFPNLANSPRSSPVFLGFAEEEIEEYDIFRSADEIFSSTLIGDARDPKKSRLSGDSGIVSQSLSISGTDDCERAHEALSGQLSNGHQNKENTDCNMLKISGVTSGLFHEDLESEHNRENVQNIVNIAPPTDQANDMDDGDFNCVRDHDDFLNFERLTAKIISVDVLEKLGANFETTLSTEKFKENLAKSNVTERNEITKQIQDWHRSLKPILAKAHSRHHFDMYDLGTNILDTFDKTGSSSVGDTVSLADVMKDKDPTFISRYFLAMLQMTNMQNINLQSNNILNTPTPLRNILLVLISRARQKISDEDNIGMFGQKKFITEEVSSCTRSPQSDKSITSNSDNETNSDIVNIRENYEKILERYKTANRQILSKEVNAHRDDFIRKLSQKHGISVKGAENESKNRIVLGEKRPILKFHYPGSKRNIEIQNAKRQKKSSDDLDSGVFSIYTGSTSTPD